MGLDPKAKDRVEVVEERVQTYQDEIRMIEFNGQDGKPIRCKRGSCEEWRQVTKCWREVLFILKLECEGYPHEMDVLEHNAGTWEGCMGELSIYLEGEKRHETVPDLRVDEVRVTRRSRSAQPAEGEQDKCTLRIRGHQRTYLEKGGG